MKKMTLLTVLCSLMLSLAPIHSRACDKIIKNPKSPKNAKHSTKKAV